GGTRRIYSIVCDTPCHITPGASHVFGRPLLRLHPLERQPDAVRGDDERPRAPRSGAQEQSGPRILSEVQRDAARLLRRDVSPASGDRAGEGAEEVAAVEEGEAGLHNEPDVDRPRGRREGTTVLIPSRLIPTRPFTPKV